MSVETLEKPKKQNVRGKIKPVRSSEKCLCKEGPTRVPINLPQFTGEKCASCFEILNWEKVVIDAKTKKPKNLRVSHYEIVDVEEVTGKEDKVIFVCRFEEDQAFPVVADSEKEKVSKLISNPNLVIGNHLIIEHREVDKEGIPIEAKPLAVKPLEKVGEYIAQHKVSKAA